MEEKIILENQKLIYYVASFFKNYPYKEDLYQAGSLGMVKAYRKYDPSINCKFTTYAFSYILGEMKKLVREDKGIKVSREITKLNLKIEKAYALLTQKLMREPSIKEVSEFLQVPIYYVEEAINSLNKIQSINEVISTDSKDLTLEDVIGYKDNIDDLLIIKEQLNNLNQEEYNIINNRYMNDLTQSETSKIMGMSQVQVSRKEQKVLKKIKNELVA